MINAIDLMIYYLHVYFNKFFDNVLILCKSVKEYYAKNNNKFNNKNIYQNTINIKKRYPEKKISRIFFV